MNQQQRDEIREKHRNLMGECVRCYSMINEERDDPYSPPEYSSASFPCWAIKYVDTLDAWEAEKANDFTDEELEAILYMGDCVLWEWGDLSEQEESAYRKAKAILEARKA